MKERKITVLLKNGEKIVFEGIIKYFISGRFFVLIRNDGHEEQFNYFAVTEVAAVYQEEEE